MLNVKAFSLACGILWGLAVLLFGAASMKFAYGTDLVVLLSSIYPGFAPSLKGLVIGLIWGFVDGAICAALFAWLYNKLAVK